MENMCLESVKINDFIFIVFFPISTIPFNQANAEIYEGANALVKHS